MQKLKQLSSRARLDQIFTDAQMTFDNFHRLVQNFGQGYLTEQEIVTLARYYQDVPDDTNSTEALLALVQEQLKRATFENFLQIEDSCLHFDRTRYVVRDIVENSFFREVIIFNESRTHCESKSYCQ